jgi:hypothetical protein
MPNVRCGRVPAAPAAEPAALQATGDLSPLTIGLRDGFCLAREPLRQPAPPTVVGLACLDPTKTACKKSPQSWADCAYVPRRSRASGAPRSGGRVSPNDHAPVTPRDLGSISARRASPPLCPEMLLRCQAAVGVQNGHYVSPEVR